MTAQLAIVMLAYIAAHLLPVTLPPLLAAMPSGAVIVVDPGSNDGTGDIAENLGAVVVRLPKREGPAVARNAGVDATDAELICFIDADCLSPESLPARIIDAFDANPRMVALTGSYDQSPAHRSCVSLYMNLRHHHTHQQAAQTGSTFWAGMGAVRRREFVEVGGFNGERYPRPMIEDIELGLRLGALGETCLNPDLQVKHLKHWTLPNMIQTDITARAIPWTRLIHESGSIPDDLNLRWSARLAALIAPFALVGLVSLPLSFFVGPVALSGLAPTLMSVAMSWGFLCLLWKEGGPRVAICGWALHQLHLFYSAVCFVLCSLMQKRETTS